MKSMDPAQLQHAFLKLRVNSHTQKLFFRDVKFYKRILKKQLPSIPGYDKDSIPKQERENEVCRVQEEDTWVE